MYKKVLWATDGSEGADLALAHAKGLALADSGSMVIVHSEEITLPGKGGGRLPLHANEDELKTKIKRQVADLTDAGISTTLHLARTDVGGAAHTIAEIAGNEDADIIVVGTRGQTALAGLLLGSVATRLLHLAPCPILAVPAPKSHGDG